MAVALSGVRPFWRINIVVVVVVIELLSQNPGLICRSD